MLLWLYNIMPKEPNLFDYTDQRNKLVTKYKNSIVDINANF